MSRGFSPSLDFLCVGAPRSGTTTLHKVLFKHPEISLPPSKELPIFHRLDFSERLWKKLVKVHWSCKGGLIGKITPQYWTEPYLPRVLREWFPDVKILVILRDPIERFVSAYRMRFIRGWETRTFREFLNDALQVSALNWAREHSFLREDGDPAPFVAVAGEYYRILLKWLDFFPRHQIHIVLFEEMVSQPQKVFDGIFSFLGVTPIKLTELPHENVPSSSLIPGTLSRGFLAIHRRLGILGEKLVENFRSYANLLLISSLNLRVQKEPPLLTTTDIEPLKSFYFEERERLYSLLKHTPPWDNN